MARNHGRTTPCRDSTQRGRLDKARQFQEAAKVIEAFLEDVDLGDAYVTLCIHAGIAAADAICCARLGEHAKGEDHQQAVMLLRQVDEAASRHLDDLLRMKTKAGYSHQHSSRDDQKRAGRAATALVLAASLR
jgi:hypothetical protein